ncbi:serine/threonine-protein kinase [Blastococcus sp. SYSU D00820]
MTGPEGQEFGPYRVLGVLGRGGMGQVLRAHDAEHERDVALKVLPQAWAGDEGYRERFRREARIAARLHEPHVIPIHRYGEIDGQLFLDMRLVEGEDLGSLLARTGPLDPARAVDVVGQVARALDAAHAGGLVHRDVKPSNVLLVARADGRDLASSAAGEDFAYLADFGIARVTDEGTGPGLTGTGLAIGSTTYMAPERFGRGPLDGRADVYSLACVLVELLTGRPPFPPGDPVALMHAHLHEQPEPLSARRPGLPAALDAVVARGLAKDPAQRWPSAGELAAAARAALAGSGVPVPAGPDDRTAVGPVPPADGARAATRVEPVAAPSRPAAATAAPAPAGRRRGAALPWALTAVLTAAVVALAVVLVLVDRGRDAAAADAVENADRLLALALPEGVTPGDCAVEEPTGDALRELTCPDGDPDAELPDGTYTALPGTAARDGFADDREREDWPRLEDVYDCGGGDTPQGWLPVTDPDDRVVGRLACYVDDETDAVLTWTWDDLGTRAVVEVRGGGEDGLRSLAGWWDGAADRGH